MANIKAWQVPVTTVGPTAASTVTWRSNGKLRVSVVVKAAFSFVPGGPMALAPAYPIADVDVHLENEAHRSVTNPSDRVPFRPRVDVLFTGHGYAPGGTPARRIQARFAIARGQTKPLDKIIDLVGDRKTAAEEPAHFIKMPVLYERAYGGPDFLANPAGVGHGQRATELPNLVYPTGWNRDAEPASFGPIAEKWPRRRRLLQDLSPHFFDKTVVEIPQTLDLSAFQCAPEDQRISQLHGDEWILLENLHPQHAQLQMVLPNVRGMAMVFQADGQDLPIDLRADTLVVHGDTERCIVTFRGSFPVPHERALDTLRITAGVETNGLRIDWSEAKKTAMSSSAQAPGTSMLDPNAPIAFLTPFDIAQPGQNRAGSAPSIPGSPFFAAASAAPIPIADANATLALRPPEPKPLTLDPIREPDAPKVINAPSTPPEAPPKAQEAPAWAWASPPPGTLDPAIEPPIAPAPKAAPDVPKRPSAKSVVYGGFAPMKK